MTQYEMAEKLSEKCNVTLEKARNTLEAGDWNMLTATHLLEQEQFRKMQELNEVASDCGGMAVQYATEEESATEEITEDAQAAEAEEIIQDVQCAPKPRSAAGATGVWGVSSAGSWPSATATALWCGAAARP